MASLSDMRVAPLLKTKWGQSWVGNEPCFNYYTPNYYRCGCTATAGAQILRYHKFPTEAVEPKTYDDVYIDDYNAELTQFGGCYDWDNMPYVPDYGMTEAQREAIGRLTYDVSVAVGSGYGQYVTWGYADRFVNLCREWGYAHAETFHYSSWHDKDEEGEGFTVAEMKSVLIPNLDAKLPVCVRIYNVDREDDTAHFAVADGYGYLDGQLGVHLNFGWDGDCDAWYILPEFSADGVLYTTINYLYGNIYPRGPARGGLASGRVLSSLARTPISGVVVTASNCVGKVLRTTTDANGIYAFMLPAIEDPEFWENEDDYWDWEVGWASQAETGVWNIFLENASPALYAGEIWDSKNYYGLDFYVQDSVNFYSLTFDANGGTVSPTSWLTSSGSAVGVLPTPTWVGYSFAGWYTALKGGTLVTPETIMAPFDVTLYAHWIGMEYSIRLDANGGVVSPATCPVECGSAVGKLPTPKWDGHVFDG